MVTYSCCAHCFDDPVHQDCNSDQLKDNHETWCSIFDCFDGKVVTNYDSNGS